jgi:hypothetical protein
MPGAPVECLRSWTPLRKRLVAVACRVVAVKVPTTQLKLMVMRT